MIFGDKNKKLIAAAESGDVDKVEKYIKKGADIETTNNAKHTPLLAAAFNGHEKVVKFLIDSGADLEASDSWGNTALHLATSMGNEEVVRLLLESKVNADIRNNDRKRALDLAATSKMKSIFESFQNSRSEKTISQTNQNHTPLTSFMSPAPSAPPFPESRPASSPRRESIVLPAIPSAQRTAPSRTSTTPDLSRIPDEFMCPISMEMMTDPVITTAGQTYERKSIEEWFKAHNTDPMAHVPVMKILTPNIALKQQIQKFKDNFAGFQLDQVHSTESDQQLAMQLRIEELTRSMESKMLRLQTVEAKIDEHDASIEAIKISLDNIRNKVSEYENRIIQCIPENIVEELERLHQSNALVDRLRVKELKEKQHIEGNAPLLEYYVAMQITLNGMITACTVISSEMVKNSRRGVVGTVAGGFHTIAHHVAIIPGASIGMDIISLVLKKVDEASQRRGVDEIMNIFKGDSLLISTVSEAVARGMTLYRESYLLDKAFKHSNRRGSVKESLKGALTSCLHNGVSNPMKVKAMDDGNCLLTGIMGGRPLGINSAASADTIITKILAYIKDNDA